MRALLLPLSLYVVADAVQYCCGGVLQGCGRQRQGMPVVWCTTIYVVGCVAALLPATKRAPVLY